MLVENTHKNSVSVQPEFQEVMRSAFGMPREEATATPYDSYWRFSPEGGPKESVAKKIASTSGASTCWISV
jgi:hypothetical protein